MFEVHYIPGQMDADYFAMDVINDLGIAQPKVLPDNTTSCYLLMT